MENTKAVEILTRWIQFLGFSTGEGRHAINSSLSDLSEASTAAVEALRKQIPEPVLVRRRDGYIRPDYYCPICNKQQKDSFKNRREGCFCERCGQRLAF